MFDIGWTELLVIAVVLIVVVGPKDLPPMIRAFGKMTANFRKMAGEFRAQFDEALREADMDDVRKTISDAQKLNPTNALRDAINPLRQMGQDIKSDLQKATQVPTSVETNSTLLSPTDVDAQHTVEGTAPASVAPEVPPSIEPAAPASPVTADAKPAAAAAATPAVVAATETPKAKTRAPRKPAAKTSEPVVAVVAETTVAPTEVKAAKPAAAKKVAAPKATGAKVSKVKAAEPVVEAVAKPKRSRAAPKVAEATTVATAAPVRKRATKKTDTPKDEA